MKLEANYKYMQLAINLAKKAQGNTKTNPLVGAIIVKNNKILAYGYHQQYGLCHAEIQAINNMHDKSELAGATMYVTLEPCVHFGKTPPCCDELIKYNFAKIIIGQRDPNPLVAGKGIHKLITANIAVSVLGNNIEVLELNRFYNFSHVNQRPFITLKYASSLDGKYAPIKNIRYQLTSKDSLHDLYKERIKYQAILIGSGTQIIDNPVLSVRNAKIQYPPIRVLIDHHLLIKSTDNLIADNSAPTYIFTAEKNKEQQAKFNQAHVKLFFANKWEIIDVMNALFLEGIQSIFVEGGPQIYQSFINSRLIDEILIYQTAIIMGSNSPNIINGLNDNNEFITCKIKHVQLIGDTDIKIVAKPVLWSNKCLQV